VLGVLLLAAFLVGAVLGRLVGLWALMAAGALLLWAGTQSDLENDLGWWVGAFFGATCAAGVACGAWPRRARRARSSR
jgi:Na+/H+ antiporter NhaD/arsenite permease-like protein